MTAAGNNTILDLYTSTTLKGTGTVTLSEGTGFAIIQQEFGGLTLTNNGNTIQSAGVIGNGGLTVVNGTGVRFWRTPAESCSLTVREDSPTTAPCR